MHPKKAVAIRVINDSGLNLQDKWAKRCIQTHEIFRNRISMTQQLIEWEKWRKEIGRNLDDYSVSGWYDQILSGAIY